MATYPKAAWEQLKNKTVQDLDKALKRDGWELERNKGRQGKKGASTIAYRHPQRPAGKNRIVLHPHPKKTMNAGLLKDLIEAAGWNEEDLSRLKLIKRSRTRTK